MSTVASVEKAARALEAYHEAPCSAAASRGHPYFHTLHLATSIANTISPMLAYGFALLSKKARSPRRGRRVKI